MDQLLNADDVAAKSCIKSDMINTLYEAIHGWICNFTGSWMGSISELLSPTAISLEHSQSYGIMVKTITVNAVADIIHAKVIASGVSFERLSMDGNSKTGDLSGAKPRFQ